MIVGGLSGEREERGLQIVYMLFSFFSSWTIVKLVDLIDKLVEIFRAFSGLEREVGNDRPANSCTIDLS